MKFALTLVLPLIMAAPALATDKMDCKNARNQMEMNICASVSATLAQKAFHDTVDIILQEVIADLVESGGLDLTRARILGNALTQLKTTADKFVEATCDLEAIGSIGGSIHSLELSSCKEAMFNELSEKVQNSVDGL